jgi:hypothetical protein
MSKKKPKAKRRPREDANQMAARAFGVAPKKPR